MKNVITVLVMFALAEAGQAATRNNDDSCDIAVRPAATLLLPFFDVAIDSGPGVGDTTLFTITNTSSVRQIAHVTLWTDWAYPVLAFNIVLTGYDVQAINLYDVLVHGTIGSPDPAPRHSVTHGSTPEASGSNPNIVDDCADAPDTLPPLLMSDVRRALTLGSTATCRPTQRVGGVHSNARGYLTIDVVSRCTNEFPTSVTYYDRDLLFDNVLIGDYQQIRGDPTFGNFAQGNPMVHIRAIPEGGPAGSNASTNLPYTFYDRYTTLAAHRRVDRRQPLPSTFAARWIESGSSLQTSYKVWREGLTIGPQNCTTPFSNSAMQIAEIIRFDESENSFGRVYNCGGVVFTCSFGTLPATSITSTAFINIYPPNWLSTDAAGWMYLNFDNFIRGISAPPRYTSPPPGTSYRASQNWVVVSMSAQGRFAVDFDAAMLGNGCSTRELAPSPGIGPAR